MKTIKRMFISIFCFIILLSSFVLTSCGFSFPSLDSLAEKTIVCTIYPAYDWAFEILQDEVGRIDVDCLTLNSADLHSYEPTFSDIATISSADIFIYVGGESDSWVEDALKNATNKNMKVINLMEVLGDKVKEEELKEGMQGESDGENDEHVWLSLKNAEIFIDEIANAICEIDEEKADYYLENASKYKTNLQELDEEYQSEISGSNKNTLVFADRFPFRYLTDDYNLNYYAAFTGCGAESEASVNTITYLAGKVDEFRLQYILILEDQNNLDIARNIKESTINKNQEILVLNSMQSVSSGIDSYLSIMEQNLEVLKKALS